MEKLRLFYRNPNLKKKIKRNKFGYYNSVFYRKQVINPFYFYIFFGIIRKKSPKPILYIYYFLSI